MGQTINFISGQRFGRLTVVKRFGNNKHRDVIWLCNCDCGNKILVPGSSLKNYNTTSCGCLRDNIMKL